MEVDEGEGWTEGEINWKSVEKMFEKNAGWQAAVRNHTFTEDRDTEQQKKRGRGREVGGWPSAHKPEAMKHYAGIMKMVLLGHTPH